MKCFHAGKTKEVTKTEYKYNEDGTTQSTICTTLADWTPHDCLKDECASFIDGKCCFKS